MKANDRRCQVSETYAKAVTKQAGNSCCCQPSAMPELVKIAGYTDEETDALPTDAVTHSFGCGNPLAFSGVQEGEVVLDLGCGAGLDLILAAHQVGSMGRVIGVDMTDEMIAKAKANVAAAGLANVDARRGIIEELPVEDGSVDWVISNCVINLSPEKERVFAEIFRVLKPGGRILISDIVAQELPDWVRENQALYDNCLAGAIDETAYLDGLRAAGLSDVTVRARHVFDADIIKAFFDSEISCCGGEKISTPEAAELSEILTGKVWSAQIFAVKPRQ